MFRCVIMLVRWCKQVSRNLLVVSIRYPATWWAFAKETYRPSTCHRCHNAARDDHGPQPAGALEEHAAQRAGRDGVGGVVLAPQIAKVRVHEVVADGDDTGRVSEKGPPACDGVEHRVQAQLRGLAARPAQTLLQTPGATQRQPRQVCHAGTVAEVVGEAACGDDALGAGEVGEGRVFERDIFEGFLVEAGQRV